MHDEEATSQVTVYRWVMGILIALILAGTGYVFNAITMSTNTKIEYLWQRILGIETAVGEQGKQIRTNNERLSVIEWQLRQVIDAQREKRRGAEQPGAAP